MAFGLDFPSQNHCSGQGLAHIFVLDETTFNEVANPGTCSRWIEQDETLGINERTNDETRRSVELFASSKRMW